MLEDKREEIKEWILAVSMDQRVSCYDNIIITGMTSLGDIIRWNKCYHMTIKELVWLLVRVPMTIYDKCLNVTNVNLDVNC